MSKHPQFYDWSQVYVFAKFQENMNHLAKITAGEKRYSLCILLVSTVFCIQI